MEIFYVFLFRFSIFILSSRVFVLPRSQVFLLIPFNLSMCFLSSLEMFLIV